MSNTFFEAGEAPSAPSLVKDLRIYPSFKDILSTVER